MIKLKDLEPLANPLGGSPKTPITGIPARTLQQLQQLQNIADETFWHKFITGFNIGHLLIILGMLSTAVWWFVTYDREITVSKLTLANQVKLYEKLSDKVDGIDEHGTHFSQSAIAKDIGSGSLNTERITKLEQINFTLLPRIEKMDASIQNINDWVKEQKLKP